MLFDRLQNVIHLVRIWCPFFYFTRSSHHFSRRLRALILGIANLCRTWRRRRWSTLLPWNRSVWCFASCAICSSTSDFLSDHDLSPGDFSGSKSPIRLTSTWLTLEQNVFSMNVRQINPSTTATLDHYVEVTIGLTLLTSWVAIALQKESYFCPKDTKIVGRALWPLFYVYNLISTLIKLGFRPTERSPNSTTRQCILDIFHWWREADWDYDRV